MRQIAILLSLASLALATTSLSEPRKISGINARTITADGQTAYVDNGGMIYRLVRGDEGVRKVDSISYEGNHSEGALYIPRTASAGFLVFKDSVCSVNWEWVKEDRMMCTGGMQLGWGNYTGGITMGKLSVCGAGRAYELEMTSNRPTLVDSMDNFSTLRTVTCEVRNPDKIEIRVTQDTKTQIYQCPTAGTCGDAPWVRSRPEDYTRNRFTSNGGNLVVVDSLGRVGSWYGGPMAAALPIDGFKTNPDQPVYIAASVSTKVDNLPFSAVGFDHTLVFGRRVDMGIEQYSRIEFDQSVRTIDIDKDVLWAQVGSDIVSFDIKESIIASLGSVATDDLGMRRAGRTLEFASASTLSEIRILRADGRLEARLPASQGAVRWVAPTSGLRLVQMGSTTQAVMIP